MKINVLKSDRSFCTGLDNGDIYVSVIISLLCSYLLYTVFYEHHSYCGFMRVCTLIIVLINIIFYLCVLNAFISYHCIFCVFIHLCIESRGLGTVWCKCYLFYNVPTIDTIFLLLLLLLLLEWFRNTLIRYWFPALIMINCTDLRRSNLPGLRMTSLK